MARPAIQTDSRQVHRFLCLHPSDRALFKAHPPVHSIIEGTLQTRLPRKLSTGPIMDILRRCPIITAGAAAEATGYRYARSTVMEYTMLARDAAQRISGYLTEGPAA